MSKLEYQYDLNKLFTGKDKNEKRREIFLYQKNFSIEKMVENYFKKSNLFMYFKHLAFNKISRDILNNTNRYVA